MSDKIHKQFNNNYAFWCPACNTAHGFVVGPDGWTWNGDFVKPTVRPSVLTLFVEPRCHSCISEGKIKFLLDCTHKFAGKEVDLPDWPYPVALTY